MNIILASASPRRKKLLQQINLPFSVETSKASEAYNPDHDPSEIVRKLALRKAQLIAESKRDVLVIGADTIVVFKNQILEKPATAEEAGKMLAQLSGNTHQVLTGVALVKKDKTGNNDLTTAFFEKTDVTFGVLDATEIKEYVKSGSPMDKAGAYGIQDDWGSVFVKKITGDYYNVVGFPLHSFYTTLKHYFPELIPHIISPTP